MSRNIARRVIVESTLVCQTPIHVGGLDSRSGSDLPLAINGEGNFYLPGTSLAGPFRDWCGETFSREEAEALWGPEDADKGHASYVIVEDAVIPAGAVSPELRDSVGIDRNTGAAADRIKFDREILPAGTRLPFRLIYEEPRTLPADQRATASGAQILASLLQALQEGEVPLGAAKSRGLGKVKLEDLNISEHSFDSPAGILNVLRGTPQSSSGLDLLCKDWKQQRRERPVIRIKIKWGPIGPFMVKSAVDGMVVDALPLLSQKDHDLRLALPGSSSKGALRTQAERITATLLNGDAKKEFLGQLARFPIVQNLFGAPKAPDALGDELKDWLPGLSALSIEDCFSKEPISAGALQHMQSGGGSGKDLPDWTRALPAHQKNEDGKPYLDPATHVAIDRWTGGASDGALFSVLEPWNFTWGNLVLTIDPKRLPRDHTEDGDVGTDTALAAIALLLLTLGDFVRGEVPLGFGTNRGFGTVEVQDVQIQIPEASSCRDPFSRNLMTDLKGLRAKVAHGKLDLEGEAVAKLRKAWTDHLKPKPPSEAKPQTAPAALAGATA